MERLWEQNLKRFGTIKKKVGGGDNIPGEVSKRNKVSLILGKRGSNGWGPLLDKKKKKQGLLGGVRKSQKKHSNQAKESKGERTMAKEAK